MDCSDQLVRIAGREVDRTDDDVISFQYRGQPRDIVGIALGGGDIRQCRDFLRMAGDGRYGMPAAGQFSEDPRTGVAGGSNQGDFHLQSPFGIQWKAAIQFVSSCEEGTYS